MGGTVGYILTFAAGAFIGGLCSYRIASDLAEDRADAEIEEMRKYFLEKAEGKRKKQTETAIEKSKQSSNKPNVADLTANKASTQTVNYTMYSEDIPEDVVVSDEPMILSDKKEFGEIEGYSEVYLTYYGDDILAYDTTGKTLGEKETEKTVGHEALRRLGKMGPNGKPVYVVYVRNDQYKSYFQISLDEREYTEAVGWEPDDEDD